MVRWSQRALVVSAIAVLVAACTSSGDDAAPTTTAGAITTLATSSTTSTTTPTTTLAPVTQISPPVYQIVARLPTDGGGDEVVVLLDPASYDTLTDIDLYDLIAEVVELFPPVSVLHVVDDPAAANVVADAEASEAARAVLADHYLARLDDGFRVTYLGPFAEDGSAVLGS